MEIKSAAENLERLVEAIQVFPSKYEDAVSSFRSICSWFEREASSIKDEHYESYLQGSFRLGAAIRPTTEEDDYDLDIVAVFRLTKSDVSQADLKRRLGVEVKSYSDAHNMTRPRDSRRCWTQDYADDRQFHVDTLPCIPDASGLRQKLEARRLPQDFVENAIAITDKDDANYEVIHPVWPNSNPRGYATWFESRMGAVLAARKAAIALAEARPLEEVPTYRAQTPLQKAVQLLKYHRDVMFADDPDDRPISIIITTLAAHSYRGEVRIQDALLSILRGMDRHIEYEHGVAWIRNPTNAMENFADKWVEHPRRRDNFNRWLETARSDFARIAAATGAELAASLTEVFGDETATRVLGGQTSPRNWQKRKSLFAAHREPPPWELRNAGTVRIKKATWARKGTLRTTPFSSDSNPIPKNADLRFRATTDIAGPFEVYWQIVNTGEEAEKANCRRGTFELDSIHSGSLTRKESSSYKGSHTVECFIVKNGYLVARSGQFLVNIA
jgi:hypothetical protein